MMSHLLKKYQLNSIKCIVIYLLLFTVSVHGLKLQYDDKIVVELNSRQRATNLDKKKFICPLPFGAFSDPEDCSAFHICAFGISRRLKCPPAYHFDMFRRTCVPFLIAFCDTVKDKRTTSAEKKTTVKDKRTTLAEKKTTVKDFKFVCPSLLGNFPHSEDCSMYYACRLFFPSLKQCPETELFDGVKKECRPENEVNCGSREKPTRETTIVTVIMPSTTTEKQTTTEEPTTTQEPTTSQEPATTQEPITTQEPTTTQEPITTQEPTTIEVPTTAKEPATIEEPTTTEEPATTLPRSPKPTGPPETDCDEDDLDCIITETGEIPDWFECPVELGAYRHPSNKKLFIYCQNWQPFVKKCGQDLIFSSEAGTCVFPGKVISSA